MPGPILKLAAASCAFVLAAPPASSALPTPAAPEIAITIDDIPVHGPLPPGESRLGVARKILAALKAAGVPEAYGFVNGGSAAANPGSESVFAAWRMAGDPLGNHGWSHLDLNLVTADAYERDVARNEPLLERNMGRADWRWFRFPFLHEGEGAKRAEIRRFLAGRGYRIAAVTMEFGDYAWNDPYARCTAKGDSASVAALERSYLQSAREAINGSRTLSHALYGRDIPYVLLIHVGAFDARMMPRLLTMFRERGFRFVTLSQAERDPAYAQDADPSKPAGPSGLVGRAMARHLPVPPLDTPMKGLDSVCR